VVLGPWFVKKGDEMFDKMKQLMEMQKKMQEVRRQLDSTTFEVSSADQALRIVMNGSQEAKEVFINDPAVPQETKTKLEKAVKDAYNKGIKRSHEIAAQKMKEVSGLNLPPGL
jgi:DNA-binding YbaB/EbfC family protein